MDSLVSSHGEECHMASRRVQALSPMYHQTWLLALPCLIRTRPCTAGIAVLIAFWPVSFQTLKISSERRSFNTSYSPCNSMPTCFAGWRQFALVHLPELLLIFSNFSPNISGFRRISYKGAGRGAMVRFSATVLAFLPVVLAANVQKIGLRLPASAAQHRNQVVQIFETSYAAYKQFAFGHDDLDPISMTFNDDRNGWGASIVDAMDTMQIMGLTNLFNEALNFSSKIDFSMSKVPADVDVFETTIRYLGGLLSVFELTNQRFPALLQNAKTLGDKLAFAWEGDNDLPFGNVDFSTNQPVEGITNIAEAGTLSLEFGTLSKHTGNDTYRQLAEKSVRHMANLPAPLPGLAAQLIDPSTGQFVDDFVSWGGGSDSYFEYLIKYPRLTNTKDPLFAKTWHTAVDSSIKTLMKTSSVGNHVYLGDFSGGVLNPVSSHLECFHGGNWLLGGRLLNNQTIVNHGLDLNEACWNSYASTVTGIGPEGFGWFPKGTNATVTGSTLAFYEAHGFFITASDYIQRPEVLESNFYAWRVTGDTKYLDRAASAINSFNKFLTSPSFKGFACINDVNAQDTGGFIDATESFWFAEVLKYLFLTFDDPNHISLDEWVFNTEAHPFKAPPELPVYSDGTLLPPNPAPFQAHPVSGPTPAISPARGVPSPTPSP